MNDILKKITALVLCIFTITASLISCDEKRYGHAELYIDLPKTYNSVEAQGFDVAYTNEISVVGIMRISFEAGLVQGIPDTLMPDEFANFYLSLAKRDAEIKSDGDLVYCEYTENKELGNHSYLMAFYRSKHAYFVIIFATAESNYQEQSAEFLKYSQSVRFISK